MGIQAQPKRRMHSAACANHRCQWKVHLETHKDTRKEGKDIKQHDNELLHLSKVSVSRRRQGVLHHHILVVQGLSHAFVLDKCTGG